MLLDVDGINPAFKDKLIEVVEGIAEPKFTLKELPGTRPTTCVFEVDDSYDVDDMVPFLKGAIKKSAVGAIMMFRVTPHGQVMWVPKRK